MEQVQVYGCVATVILPKLLNGTEKADLCNFILKFISVTQLARYEERGPGDEFLIGAEVCVCI